MDQPRYDIVFTGQLVEGTDPATAQANFARLFKMPAEQAQRLFTGKPQMLKRGVDKQEALKYKAALHKAGLMITFRAHKPDTNAASMSPVETTPAPAAEARPDAQAAADDWSLAPAGSDVLRANERKQIQPVAVDTSNIKMASAFLTPEPEHQPAPPAPDTSHISVAEVGADILADKPEPPPPLPLDLDQLSVAPPGTELEELKDERPPLNPDTSALSVADVGADLLEGQESEAVPDAPNVDHIKLADG